MRRRALLLLASTIVACSSSSSGGSSPSTSGCDAWASALCAKYRACDGRSFDFYPDEASCARAVSETCQLDVAAPRAKISTLDACTQRVASESCVHFLNGHGAFCGASGDRANGAPCGESAQCSSGACGKDGECGVCADAPKIPGPGESCVASARCIDGARCDGSTLQCVTTGFEGDACTSSNDCFVDLECDGNVCTALPKNVGDPCSALGSCDPFFDLKCDATSRTCVSTVSNVGDPCGPDGTTLDCIGFAYCDIAAGKCARRPALGQPCTATTGCAAPAHCVSGTCAIFDPSVCG